MKEKMKSAVSGLFLLAFAFWFWHSLIGNPLNELALIKHGRTTSGFIVQAWEDAEDGDGKTSWFNQATYNYTVNGKTYSHDTETYSGRLDDKFRDLKQPYAVQVDYLSENPSISRIHGSGWSTIGACVFYRFFLGGLLLLAFSLPGLLILRGSILGEGSQQETVSQVEEHDA